MPDACRTRMRCIAGTCSRHVASSLRGICDGWYGHTEGPERCRDAACKLAVSVGAQGRGNGGAAVARERRGRFSAHLRCIERIEEVLETNGALALHRVWYADVVVLQLDGVARAAGIAVEEILAAADTADAALVAMKLLLGEIIVVEVADRAKVRPKGSFALAASLARRLFLLACEAHD